MAMAPAEIVASLKELCETEGPRLKTARIVRWIESHGGFESHDTLIAFAKKMRARQFARQLMYDDPESGLRIKRLWSLRDPYTGAREYNDIAQLSPERRRKLIHQYAQFARQMRSVRRAMADFFSGQGFFDFYTSEDQSEPAQPNKST